ncbi:unnamed protein product [Clavelina lepadiformis]|uniref:Oxysterol-binding protein n=1 Tax=Clavelina lepadiformis TaxID=159417 RepID=A0ABP0GGH0_CLALP
MDVDDLDSLEEKLLYISRHGQQEKLCKLLQENDNIDINCKGQSKSNRSWTPLHLASYFGHKDVLEILLEHGANPNVVNQTGDTALHKASLTSREDLVMCLLKYDASTSIVNDEGKRASQIAEDSSIKHTIEAAEQVQTLKAMNTFLQAVKQGQVDAVKEMISSDLAVLDTFDNHGNTALHHAAMRDQRSMAVVLMQNGANPNAVNKDDEKAVDLCHSKQMRKLLEVRPFRQNFKFVQRFEGPLMKRTRILGPKWYWVVLEKGVMSYFAKRADAALGARRKMFKYLTEAAVTLRDENQYGLIVRFFDGSYHNLMVHQKNNPLIHRQQWIEAIREHVRYSNHFVVEDHVIVESDNDDDNIGSMVDVKNAVQNAQVHHQVLKSHIDELTQIVQKYVANDYAATKNECQRMSALVLGKAHKVLTTSTEMSESFSKCLAVLERQEQARELQLSEEREKNRVFEQALQALATEHHNLEKTITTQGQGSTGEGSPQKAMPASPADMDMGSDRPRHYSGTSKNSSAGFLSDEDEFYDAVSGDSDTNEDLDGKSVEEDYDAVSESAPNDAQIPRPSTSSNESSNHSLNDPIPTNPVQELNGQMNKAETTAYRTSLPVPMFSRDEFSIWHILRQCIGKELSKITMPVIFNEPLSFIQRLCEYMEYSCLLEEACKAEDSIKRMEYVAAFAVSALASQLERTGKPFNPLLGETYENQRPDLGFNWVSEQVSHHPPVSAFQANGTNPQYPFVFHGSVHPKLKFWGKSVEVEPKGTMVLKLTAHDETYSWTNPKCSVHNIVVGKLWMEQHGIVEILNHKTNERCVVTFKPYSWFRNDLNKIEGFIFTDSKEKVRVLEGDWTKYVYSLDMDTHQRYVAMTTGAPGSSHKGKSRTKSQSTSSDDEIMDILTTLGAEGYCKSLWSVRARPKISTEMYNMTEFAMSLNQEEVKSYDLAPTDCRLRPDIRALENGEIDGASEEKHRLEEKQRTARKLRNKKKKEWTPRWFHKVQSPHTKSQEWLYNGGYHTRDWTKCPDIF